MMRQSRYIGYIIIVSNTITFQCFIIVNNIHNFVLVMDVINNSKKKVCSYS